MFPWWPLYHSFPAAQWLPAPPVWCPCCVHWRRCTSVGLLIPPFLGGEVLIPMWPFSGTSLVSNTSITLVSLLPHGSPSPTSTEMADWRTLWAHCPSNTVMPPSGLSLVSLVLSLFPFKSSFNLFQWALLTPVQRSFSPFETVIPHLVASRPGVMQTNPWSRNLKFCCDSRL